MTKQEAQEFYLKLKQADGSTEATISFLKKFKEDGILKYLIDMEGLTIFEQNLIQGYMEEE